MIRKMILIFISIVMLFGCCTPAFAEDRENEGKWEKFEIEYKKGRPPLNYWVYTPRNMRPGLPLIVYLHSSAGMKNNALNDALPAYIRDDVVYSPDAVIVVPQHPGNNVSSYWEEVSGTVNCIVDDVILKYEIDTSRISLTGFSLGGIGVWDIAGPFPGKYKRILSICGKLNGKKDAESYAGSEIRIYTVPKNPVVNSSSVIQFVDPLNQAGAKAVHIELPSSHARAPINIYSDPEVQEWLYLKEPGTAIRTIPVQIEDELETAIAEDDPDETSEEWKLKKRSSSFNKVVEINGRHYVVFAQTSPEYSDINAGEKNSTTVGGSTCSAFAFANVLINSVNFEDLKLLKKLAKSPIKIDTKSVLKGKGVKESESFEITREEDIFRYFPLALINIIGGNNSGYGNGLGGTGSYKYFLNEMNICFEKSKEIDKCVEAIEKEGAMVVVCTGGSSSPIANKYGHFFVMADVKDNRVYFIDSMFHNSYKLDNDGIIFVQEPGVFWVARENLNKLSIHGTSFIVYPKENRTEYTQDDYNKLIERSNTRIIGN